MSDILLDYEGLISQFPNQPDRKALTTWIKQNRKEIVDEVTENVFAAYRGVLVPVKEENLFYTELPDFLATSTPSAMFSHIVHAGSRYENQSCHKVMFGSIYSVFLNDKVDAFLDALPGLPMDKSYSVYTSLKKNRLLTNNPNLILLHRCQEVASIEGRRLSNLIPPVHGYYRFWDSIVAGNISVVIDNPGRKSIAGPILYLIALCVSFKTPVDYFLLQDYSALARRKNGKELTPIERDFLSAYLSATPAARESAIRQIGYNALGL